MYTRPQGSAVLLVVIIATVAAGIIAIKTGLINLAPRPSSNNTSPSVNDSPLPELTPSITPAPASQGIVQNGSYTYPSQNIKSSQKTVTIPSFTITVPAGWMRFTPDASSGEIAHFESPQMDSEKAEGGKFTTNAIVNVRISGGFSNLDDFVTKYKSSGSQVNKFQLISSSPVVVNGQTGYALETKFESTVKSKSLLVHELDRLFFKNDLGFLVKGYSAEYAWSKRSTELKSSLDTFRFN